MNSFLNLLSPAHLCPLCGHSRFATLSNLYRHERTCRGRPVRPGGSADSSGAEQTIADGGRSNGGSDTMAETPPMSPRAEQFPPPILPTSPNRTGFDPQQLPRSSSESVAMELQNQDPSSYAMPFPAPNPMGGAWTTSGEQIPSPDTAYPHPYHSYSSPPNYDYPAQTQTDFYQYPAQVHSIPVPDSSPYSPTHNDTQWTYGSPYPVPSNNPAPIYTTSHLISPEATTFIPTSPVAYSESGSTQPHYNPQLDHHSNTTYYAAPHAGEPSYYEHSQQQESTGVFEGPSPGSNWHAGTGGDLGGSSNTGSGQNHGHGHFYQGQH